MEAIFKLDRGIKVQSSENYFLKKMGNYMWWYNYKYKSKYS